MLLAVVATEREAQAVLDGLPGPADHLTVGPFDARGSGPLVVLVSGIGAPAAAAATATALALGPYDAALSLGICGGFAAAGLDLGDLVVADPVVEADIGVAAEEGWLSLGAQWPSPGARGLAAAIAARHGQVLTVNTVTSTDERAAELLRRHPGSLAEAMEGGGVARSAHAFGVAAYEVRSVSNAVGRRARERWDVEGALAALTRVAPVLIAFLEPA